MVKQLRVGGTKCLPFGRLGWRHAQSGSLAGVLALSHFSCRVCLRARAGRGHTTASPSAFGSANSLVVESMSAARERELGLGRGSGRGAPWRFGGQADVGEVAASLGRLSHEGDQLEPATASRQPAGATSLPTAPATRGGGAPRSGIARCRRETPGAATLPTGSCAGAPGGSREAAAVSPRRRRAPRKLAERG